MRPLLISQTWKNHTKVLDKVSRGIFPQLFLAFPEHIKSSDQLTADKLSAGFRTAIPTTDKFRRILFKVEQSRLMNSGGESERVEQNEKKPSIELIRVDKSCNFGN